MLIISIDIVRKHGLDDPAEVVIEGTDNEIGIKGNKN
jgi:hypothetical protein